MENEPEALNEDLSELTKVEAMRRIELITGAERRRNRSPDEKAAIVAESMVPGAVIAEVARRHGLSPQQLYGWRSALRAKAQGQVEPTFSSIIVDDSSAAVVRRGDRTMCTEAPHTDVAPSIELTIGAARVIIRGAADQRTLAAVFKALKGLT